MTGTGGIEMAGLLPLLVWFVLIVAMFVIGGDQ